MLHGYDEARDNDPDDHQTDHDLLIKSIEDYLWLEPADDVDPTPFDGCEGVVDALCLLHDRVEAGDAEVTEFPPDTEEEWYKVIGFTGEQQLLLSSTRTILRERRARGVAIEMLDDGIKHEGQQLADDIVFQDFYELRQSYPLSEVWSKPLGPSHETFGKN